MRDAELAGLRLRAKDRDLRLREIFQNHFGHVS